MKQAIFAKSAVARAALLITATILLVSRAPDLHARVLELPLPPAPAFAGEDLLAPIKVLASDEFEGRAPGSKGEELTVNYLVDQFKRLGLKPGNPDGTYIQQVPMVGFKAESTASFEAGGKPMEMQFPQDYVAWSPRLEPETDVKGSEVVFVGYGVVAPEYGWDDYKGVDVRGKTILMLVNDPPVPDPANPGKLDSKVFKGSAMTYYGRWTYKYEIAAEKGAAGAIIIHETGPAGYPYFVIINSRSRENFDLPLSGKPPVSIASWISFDQAKKLFGACGRDFDELKRSAARKDFRPVPLGAKVNFHVHNTNRDVRSRNVIAKIEGSDPKLRDEYIVYTAHWDHLGRDPKLTGDQIFNGALDNASGVACLLELARAFARPEAKPKRSILFLAVTGEEQGLLGAKYYATHPLYPLAKTLANLNMDGFNQWGRTKDLPIIGYGNSTLDDIVRIAAGLQDRVVMPEPSPEKGYFYRSDHFEFAKQGVPALFLDKDCNDFIGKPPGYG
ncbi:MAG TPA: M28 family peptidase, partial [Verrucomicrobiae bacterium]|nr:M28 family peptidase [Verrucomicrobiae bacterium]